MHRSMILRERDLIWSREKKEGALFQTYISPKYFKVNQLWSSVVWTVGWLGGLSLAVPGLCTQVAAKPASSPPSIVNHSLSFFLQVARDIKLDPHLSGSQSPLQAAIETALEHIFSWKNLCTKTRLLFCFKSIPDKVHISRQKGQQSYKEGKKRNF